MVHRKEREASGKKLKPGLLAGLLVLTGLVMAVAGAWWSYQTKILVVVNGERLTRDQLYQEMYARVGPQAMEDLISKKLILQEGKKLGIEVTPEEVREEIETLKDLWGLSSEEELQEMLQEYQMTIGDLEEEVASWRVARKIVASTIEVTEEEMLQYFTEHREEFSSPEQVKVRHILLDTEQEAVSVLEEIRRGADFAEVAKQKSVDSASKDHGGEIGFIARGQVEPEFEKAAFGLQQGEISGVVATEYGYHIIQVLEKKAAVNLDFNEVRTEVETTLTGLKTQEMYEPWLEELHSLADIQYRVPR